jgi:autotransporter-associated beta strand protein
LTNIINGLAGNLTIYNNTDKAATPSVEFQYPSFTFDLPIDLNVGGQGGGLYLEDVNTSGTHVWENVISDAGGIWRNGSKGQTILTATNTYTGGTLLTDGPLGVATNSVFNSGAIVAGPLGTGTLTVDTRSGSPMIFASGGAVSVGNAITWYSNNVVGPAFVILGSNELTFAGDVDFNETNRLIDVSNTAVAVFAGPITDDGLVLGLSISGTGDLYLDGTNTYTGGTTNSANLLAGSGSVAGPVIVQAGGTLGGGGPDAIGTFTIGSYLDLSGNISVRVNKSLTQTSDEIVASGGATNLGTGTVTVNNLGSAFLVGDKFTLFGAPVVNGGAMSVTGGEVQWTNNLAVDGSISVLSLTPPPPPPSPSINAASSSGGNLIFSGTNGTAGGTYYVLESTNLALPVSEWTVLSTNLFGPGGAFSVTNPITPTPGKYFILEIPNP